MLTLHPEYYLYKIFNPPKYKLHGPIKIPKASKSYEIRFENNSLFKKPNVLDENCFSSNSHAEVECEFLLCSENLFLAYQKKERVHKDSVSQYNWHAVSRTLPFEKLKYRPSILNIKRSHNINFFQKKNTEDMGFLDINKVSYDDGKSKVILTTTPFDLELEVKKNEYLKKYEYDRALFSLTSKVFIIGLFFHIGISELLSMGLNKIVEKLVSNLPVKGLEKTNPVFSMGTVSGALTLIGCINACLKKPNTNLPTLCLGGAFLLTAALIARFDEVKINPVISVLISSFLYSNCAKIAMLENRKFCFFTKNEFEKEFLLKVSDSYV
jgi:hypothetical protein